MTLTVNLWSPPERWCKISLTGESVAVGKDFRDVLGAETGLGDQHNMAFMSTVITYGRGQGLVTSTGMDTEIGKISEMIHAKRCD